MEKKTCNVGDWRTSVCLAGVPSPHCLVRAWCYCFRSELSSSSHEAPPPTYCWATGEGRLLHVVVKLPKKVVTARQSLVATILLPPYLSLFWSDRRLEHCPAKERYCCQRSCLRKWPEFGSWLKFGVAASLMCTHDPLLCCPLGGLHCCLASPTCCRAALKPRRYRRRLQALPQPVARLAAASFLLYLAAEASLFEENRYLAITKYHTPTIATYRSVVAYPPFLAIVAARALPCQNSPNPCSGRAASWRAAERHPSRNHAVPNWSSA